MPPVRGQQSLRLERGPSWLLRGLRSRHVRDAPPPCCCVTEGWRAQLRTIALRGRTRSSMEQRAESLWKGAERAVRLGQADSGSTVSGRR